MLQHFSLCICSLWAPSLGSTVTLKLPRVVCHLNAITTTLILYWLVWRKLKSWRIFKNVWKPVSIWCDHHLTDAVYHISLSWSGCWLWPVESWSTPLQWLCEVAGYWQELEHAVIYADPEHPKHAQWVTCPVSMLAMLELGCFQLPGIVYRSLQHGAVHYHATTWGNGRGWMAQQWASGSRHGISVHSKCHQ